MSSVRMCDRCGKVFSENSDDWETYSASKRDRKTGQTVTRVLDACPSCAIGSVLSEPTPVLEAQAETV